MHAVLVSTYDLGHQPFGLASPAAWLRQRGHRVTCVDLSIETLTPGSVHDADLVAFYLPMHTATRLSARAVRSVRRINATAHLAAYGLYAPLNREYLQSLGVSTVIGGEFESELAELADRLGAGDKPPGPALLVPLDRLQFVAPDRQDLPSLNRYARLVVDGLERTVGYTEASRGCKHLCRHCPVVPVYEGAFRIVQAGVVLEDIRRQVHTGAAHITFGDPDFFNGPTHALRIVEAMHGEFPQVTYDVTIKVEHLLKHRSAIPVLRDTGCLFVTSAVESVDDRVLRKLDKGHTRAGFAETGRVFREAGLRLNPTFIAFMPWISREGYLDLLSAIRELELVDDTGSVQLALRLLIPNGSRLLELEEIRRLTRDFDTESLAWTWSHPDPAMDDLARAAIRLVAGEQKAGSSRRDIYAKLWELAGGEPLPDDFSLMPRAAVPYLNEPWYC